MTSQLKFLHPTDPQWGSFVESTPNATIFHHPAWANLLAECYGYSSFAAIVCNEANEIQAGIPIIALDSFLTGRRWVSLPFTDHCPPLANDEDSLKTLLRRVAKLQIEKQLPRIEIRSAVPEIGLTHSHGGLVLHVTNLSSDSEAVFRSFRRTGVQQLIRKATRQGVTVRTAVSRNDLNALFELLLKTRHRLGVPVQPKRYFELLSERITNAGLGFVLLAHKNEVPIAGGVFLKYKSTVTYKHTGSDMDYWELHPNHLLVWTAIQWACDNGYKFFDWGRTEIDNRSLRSYKSGWGSYESELVYSVLSTAGSKDGLKRAAGLARPILRRLPRWVTRTTGELLYRHFG